MCHFRSILKCRQKNHNGEIIIGTMSLKQSRGVRRDRKEKEKNIQRNTNDFMEGDSPSNQ